MGKMGDKGVVEEQIRYRSSFFPHLMQVLSFDAYYQEAVHERREEQYRVRTCKIYFYLEDDSIQVIEPRLKNAGVPQGSSSHLSLLICSCA